MTYLDGLSRMVDVRDGWSWAMMPTPCADLGLTNLFGALTTGGRVHLMTYEQVTDPATVRDYFRRHRVDAMKLVPSQLAALWDDTDPTAVLPAELLILAGEPCPWSLVDQIRTAAPNLAVHNHYGPTETLWVALPQSDRDTGRDFAHYAPEPVTIPGGVVRVFLGELVGSRSPVHTFTPLLGAQIDLDGGVHVRLDVDPAFEHGVLLDQGSVEVAGTTLEVADMAYHRAGSAELALTNRGERPARVLLLGGPPFGEELVMWWNFVGRSHDDIVAYRRMWEDSDEVFGAVDGYRGSVARLPAPPLPNATLRPRPNPTTKESHDHR